MNDTRQEKMAEIMEQLEVGVANVFTSENYIQLLRFWSRFHKYSFNNCILILAQRPTASRVASFQTWKKLGYPVNKGEHGIRILVPIPYTYQRKEAKKDVLGNSIEEVVDAKGLSFRVGNVFDASQVNGKLPTLVHELQDDPKSLKIAVDQLIGASENIQYDPTLVEGNANGYYRLDSSMIFLREGMSSMQTFKTLIHEKAHSMMHHADAESCSRQTAEVQAESIAFVVTSAFGLDTSDYSFPYIASWSDGRELKELKSSLAVIEKTAKELMNWVCNSSNLELLEVV